MLDEANRTLDPVRRLALYQQAQDMLIDDAPMAIMSYETTRCLVKPWVRGLIATPLDADYGWCGAGDPLTISLQH
jgi:ABC-type transport system substrate-binding protein